jgi:hypothetical protein
MILLFDIDGVLIQNLAYRAALRQTVAYFSRRLGLGEIVLTDSDIDVYESQSITVEWDSGAIGVAALLVGRLKANDPAKSGTSAATLPPRPSESFGSAQDKRTGQGFWEALDELGAHSVAIDRPDFSGLARRVGEATPPGGLPAHAALSLLLTEVETQPAASLLRQLLLNCYDIDRAPAMQLFQNYVLGHEQYANYYGLSPHVETEPLLEKLDRTNLQPDMRARLLARRSADDVFPVIYTARPSLGPIELAAQPRGYTPEAEIARRQSGLETVPVMGFGKVAWLAQQVGLAGADLVKPSPVESMAAIATARTGLEIESLKAAFAVARGDHLRYPLTACAHETVHVFEDSASSLRAVTRAVELLNRQGLDLRLVRHGIAPAGSPKRAALEKAADRVHEDVNEALAQVLGELQEQKELV